MQPYLVMYCQISMDLVLGETPRFSWKSGIPCLPSVCFPDRCWSPGRSSLRGERFSRRHPDGGDDPNAETGHQGSQVSSLRAHRTCHRSSILRENIISFILEIRLCFEIPVARLCHHFHPSTSPS